MGERKAAVADGLAEGERQRRKVVGTGVAAVVVVAARRARRKESRIKLDE